MRWTKALQTVCCVIIAAVVFSGCGEEETSAYTPTFVEGNESELIVGIHPYLNAQKTYLAFGPVLRHLEKDLEGVRLVLETSSDYADYERKLFAGRFDLSLPNPYQTLKSRETGYRIVAKVKSDADFRGLIVARKDRHIRSASQLRGQLISFPAPTALAATMMPKWYLYEKGLNVDKEALPRYVGSQYSSIMNAYSGDTAAAATWPSPWQTWQKENPVKAREMEVVWSTPGLVNNGFVIRNGVDPKIAERIVDALCALDATEEGKAVLIPTGFAGFERADEQTYKPVELFLQRYDRVLGAGR